MLEKIRHTLLKWAGRSTEKTEAADDAPPLPDAPPEGGSGPADPRENWKREALDNFESWLADLPDTPPAASDTEVEACDLYTLLSEFSALRQEIRMQNREQHRTMGALEALSADIRAAVRDVDGMRGGALQAIQAVEGLSRELRASVEEMRRQVAEAVRREAEKQTVRPFLDIRDALIRGRQASRDIAGKRGFFRKPPREMESVIEGYDMALRRFDRALFAVGIHPVNAAGKPFDPATMRAVETCRRPDMEKGQVAVETLCGFVRGGEVIRTAEVIVNE
ncbi:nucleotide exchange factor GrpE [Desulfococcus sp.]|uniref:nucleotide exchange factor GrpE n=1 Tax=Desulfococcus sp. TaxID=2025834 RepID=UPI003594045C